MTENSANTHYCINCGRKTKSLFKKYSETVLKLSECENCSEIADKYVEYDIVIIIIDLVLLNSSAYRHILLNTDFKSFWKLSVILVLLETYCNWALTEQNINNPCPKSNRTEPSLSDLDMSPDDVKFYLMGLNCLMGNLCFVALVYGLTVMYMKYLAKFSNIQPSLTLVLKTMSLASTGMVLQLLSMVWDLSLYNYHLHFITLYTCLSQLLAYRAIFGSPKIWCLLVIFSSHFAKISVTSYLSTILDSNFLANLLLN